MDKQMTFDDDSKKPKQPVKVKFSPFIDHNGVDVNAPRDEQ